MKKLILTLTLILFLALSACNSGYDRAVINGNRTESVSIYKEIGGIVIIVTDKAVYITEKSKVTFDLVQAP